MFSTKYFFSQTKKSSNLFKIFPPFTSNGMILCYRKSYFNSVLNQFQMTEKRKHQCKESGHLAVRTLEYTPLLSHISTLDLCEVTPLIYLPSFYHSLVYLITENFGINTLALKFWRKRSGILLKAYLEIQTYRLFPEHFCLDTKYSMSIFNSPLCCYSARDTKWIFFQWKTGQLNLILLEEFHQN